MTCINIKFQFTETHLWILVLRAFHHRRRRRLTHSWALLRKLLPKFGAVYLTFKLFNFWVDLWATLRHLYLIIPIICLVLFSLNLNFILQNFCVLWRILFYGLLRTQQLFPLFLDVQEFLLFGFQLVIVIGLLRVSITFWKRLIWSWCFQNLRDHLFFLGRLFFVEHPHVVWDLRVFLRLLVWLVERCKRHVLLWRYFYILVSSYLGSAASDLQNLCDYPR